MMNAYLVEILSIAKSLRERGDEPLARKMEIMAQETGWRWLSEAEREAIMDEVGYRPDLDSRPEMDTLNLTAGETPVRSDL